MDQDLFGHVDDIVRSLAGEQLMDVRTRSHRYGIKVWFGTDKPTPRHYEAQVLGRHKVDGVKGVALEIGFHAEARDEKANQEALDLLLASESVWRPTLGPEATPGPFFDAPNWRRLSDVWLEPDLSEDDIAFEIASRLADYLVSLQPLLDEA